MMKRVIRSSISLSSGSSSVGSERHSDKVEVVGSSPTCPTICVALSACVTAKSPSGLGKATQPSGQITTDKALAGEISCRNYRHTRVYEVMRGR